MMFTETVLPSTTTTGSCLIIHPLTKQAVNDLEFMQDIRTKTDEAEELEVLKSQWILLCGSNERYLILVERSD